METQHKRDEEGESAKAQEGIAEYIERIEFDTLPIERDEADGLTLEEFGKKRKEEKVKGERANKKSKSAVSDNAVVPF